MSLLDQAFIKAFTKGTTLPEAASSGSMRPGDPSAASSTAKTPSVEPLHVPEGMFHRVHPASSSAGLAVGTSHVPAPHLRLIPLAAADSSDAALPVVDIRQPSEAAIESAEPSSGHRSQGEPILEQPASVPPRPHFHLGQAAERVEAERAAGFSCQWEVDRFHWPRICDQLIGQAGECFQEAQQKLTGAAGLGQKVVAITSATGRAGATTLALCLARLLARAGAKVVLVDANLDDPQLALRLGVNIRAGWEKVLSEKLPLEEAATASIEDHLVLVPLSRRVRVAETADYKQSLAEILQKLAAAFELVLVDAGRAGGWLSGSGPQIFHAALVVQDVRAASRAEAEHVLARLHAAGITPLGIAENFIHVQVPHEPQTDFQAMEE